MKKFVLTQEYLKHVDTDYIRQDREPIAVASDLHTLMRSVETYASKILGVRNTNFLSWGNWDINRYVTHAEIIIYEEKGDDMGDGIRFIIDEVYLQEKHD